MYYSGNLEDDMPLGTKYFVVYDLEIEKILYFDDISPDKDEMVLKYMLMVMMMLDILVVILMWVIK